MAEPIPISLGQGSNKGRYGQEGLTEFVNVYAERLGEGGKVEWPIHAINGLSTFATLTGGGAVRGVLAVDDTLLAVSGRRMYATNIFGSPVTDVGGIPSDGFVTMARNRKTPNPQVVVVASGEWFIYQAGTVTQGADPDLPPPVCVVEIDGYFVFPTSDGRWFISSVDDVTIDGLDFTAAQSSPDANVMAAVRGRELVIFGQRSMEFYVNNAASEDFPFSRVQAVSMGCYAGGTVAKIVLQPTGGSAADSLIWAATDHKGGFSGVHVLNGYSGTKISTAEIDRLIRDETDVSALRAMAWTEDGHAFYCISGTSFSMCWDSGTGQWHARKSYELDRWRPSCHAQIGQKHVFGDYASNVLYVSNPATLTDAGESIVASITLPTVHMGANPFRVSAVHIDALTGVGTVTGAASDTSPQMMLSYSDDGGASFGGERMIDLGETAQRHVRIKELAFGRFDTNGVIFRLSWSANVVKGVLGMSIEADKLRA